MIAITNGKILSANINGEIASNESVVIKDDKIVFVGSNESEMGDGSVRHTVDAYEYAQKKVNKNTRNVIAHITMTTAEDIEKMAENNMIACMQPTWMGMAPAEKDALDFICGKERTDLTHSSKWNTQLQEKYVKQQWGMTQTAPLFLARKEMKCRML